MQGRLLGAVILIAAHFYSNDNIYLLVLHSHSFSESVALCMFLVRQRVKLGAKKAVKGFLVHCSDYMYLLDDILRFLTTELTEVSRSSHLMNFVVT